jgi:hypothetical protein
VVVALRRLSPTYVAWKRYEQDIAEVLDSLRARPGPAAHHQRFEAWLAAEDVPVDAAHASGLRVIRWTVNDVATMNA